MQSAVIWKRLCFLGLSKHSIPGCLLSFCERPVRTLLYLSRLLRVKTWINFSKSYLDTNPLIQFKSIAALSFLACFLSIPSICFYNVVQMIKWYLFWQNSVRVSSCQRNMCEGQKKKKKKRDQDKNAWPGLTSSDQTRFESFLWFPLLRSIQGGGDIGEPSLPSHMWRLTLTPNLRR